MLLLFVFIISAEPAPDCGKRTAAFSRHNGINRDQYYFVPVTFSAAMQVCTEGATYRGQIIDHFVCRSHKWCAPNGTWGNYVPTLIIPHGCDIYGNRIMVLRDWARQLGTGHIEERRLVYGPIFAAARNNILACCDHNVAISECSAAQSSGATFRAMMLAIIVYCLWRGA